jgi:hypothetical protein
MAILKKTGQRRMEMYYFAMSAEYDYGYRLRYGVVQVDEMVVMLL